ncbi:MAG: 6-bladed beta-propeller, partial [Candidatus Aminicenantes bacterium]|nr:6-bladed beta-propeller [Candidatus Aminicenantes bacterium]
MIKLASLALLLLMADSGVFPFARQQWEGAIKRENGIEIIENPSVPIFNESILELMPEFVIGCDDKKAGYVILEITDMAIDESGFIYLYDRKGAAIFVFNEQGNYIRKFGRAGTGPGELDGVSEIEVADRHLFALGSAGFRIHVFKDDGIYENTILTPGTLSGLRVDKKKRFFAKRFTQKIYQIIQFGMDSTISHSYQKKAWEEPRFWQNLMSYELFPNGDIIAGESSDYKLSVYDLDGRHKKTITKKYNPIKLPIPEIEYLQKKNTGLFKIPVNYDPFWSIFLDDDGRIIVNT